jgi:hypothetical protein
MVVPGATVTLAGWKFSDWSAPTFWGMIMVRVLAAADVLVAMLVLVLVVVGVVEVVVVD